jgi:hypothetical protein
MILLFPLAIVRAFLIVLVLIGFAALSAVAGAGADITKPFPTWRRVIVHISRPLGRLVVFLLGFWVRVKGWENYRQARKDNVVCAGNTLTPLQYHVFVAVNTRLLALRQLFPHGSNSSPSNAPSSLHAMDTIHLFRHSFLTIRSAFLLRFYVARTLAFF